MWFWGIKMDCLWQSLFWIISPQIAIIMEDSSVPLKSDVSSHTKIFTYDWQFNRLEFLVLYNLVLSKNENNPKFNGYRNAERLVQETIQRYMLDLTGFLSEAGKFKSYIWRQQRIFKSCRNGVGALRLFWTISKYQLISNQFKMTRNLLTKSVAISAMCFSIWLMMLIRISMIIVSWF